MLIPSEGFLYLTNVYYPIESSTKPPPQWVHVFYGATYCLLLLVRLLPSSVCGDHRPHITAHAPIDARLDAVEGYQPLAILLLALV
jgi:hypothetical protein